MPEPEHVKVRVVLDTDLGSDVDDALALAVLLGSPEVDLLGVVTVYGDVELRARLTRGFAALAGRPLLCLPGAAEPLSGRPVWLSGEEGTHFPDLPAEPSASLPANDWDGVGWLVEQARAAAGELEIVALGPLTNLAQALRQDPGFAANVRRVWLMGGQFGPDADGPTADRPDAHRPDADDPNDDGPDAGGPDAGDGLDADEWPAEHNFASDAVAADEVIRSGLPITVVGVEVTRLVRLGEAEVAELSAVGTPLGVQLERETRAWMAYWDEPFDVPHDAVAVIRMLRPDLFTERTVRIRVDPDGERAGRVVQDQDGFAVNLVTGLDIPAVTREILDRIRAAQR